MTTRDGAEPRRIPHAIAPRRPFRNLTAIGRSRASAHAPKPGRLFWSADATAYRPPDGLRVVNDHAEAVAALELAVALDTRLRADGRATRLAVGHAVLAHRHPDTGLAIVGHAQLARAAADRLGRHVGRSTAGNHVRALVAAGVLGVAQHGCSKAVTGSRDLAPVYVALTDDVLDEHSRRLIDALAQALDGHHPVGPGSEVQEVVGHSRKTGENLADEGGSPRQDHPERYVPRNHTDRAASVCWLIAQLGWRPDRHAIREMTVVTRPFFAAGWTALAVHRAWLTLPDGTTVRAPLADLHNTDRPIPVRMRKPWAVLTYRLQAWRDHTGRPLPAPVPATGAPARRPAPPSDPAPRRRAPAAARAILAAYGLHAGAARA